MSIVLLGSTSGSCTLQEQAIAGTTTLTLPTVSGTIITTGSPQSGSVLQVVQGSLATQTAVTSSSYVDSGLSASITPSSATSKILVLINLSLQSGRSVNDYLRVSANIVRGATQVFEQTSTAGGRAGTGAGGDVLLITSFNGKYLDTPNTTSSTTYKAQLKLSTTSNSANVQVNNDGGSSTMILMEIAA
jgi:hypothetical protein